MSYNPIFASRILLEVIMFQEPDKSVERFRCTYESKTLESNKSLQLLEPPTIEAIRFRTPRNIFDVAGIDESDLKASGLKDLKQGDPVHPGRFHHDRGNPTGR